MIAFRHHCIEMLAMAAITIRNLPDETARALKARATKAGRSTEAEVREILNAAVRPAVGIGTALADIGKRFGGVDLTRPRTPSPARVADFES
jgi:plasmid stability protein